MSDTGVPLGPSGAKCRDDRWATSLDEMHYLDDRAIRLMRMRTHGSADERTGGVWYPARPDFPRRAHRPVFAEADIEVLRIFIARRAAWTWAATGRDRP